MLILPAADRVARPWKNGLGLTCEIATFPADANLDAFDWRISIATVHQGGPFSFFQNVDRRLAVLQGCLLLAIGDRQPIEIKPGRAPVLFPGEARVDARLPSGPVIDLNVMTRRDRFDASFHRLEIDGPIDVDCDEPILILTETSRLGLACESQVHQLSPLDAVMFNGAECSSVRLEPSSQSIIHIIRLHELHGD